MKRVIVTTTINPPTEAVRRFDAPPGWELMVVGDRRTPTGYALEKGRYYGPAEQEAYDRQLSDAIGWDCIQRRNFGILFAWDAGADVVALVDDDNIPRDGWGESLMVGAEASVTLYHSDLPAFDPVGATNYPHLWHRGYPLALLSRRSYDDKTTERLGVDIQADFWDGDPDIDAICRLEHAPECRFDPACFPLASDAPSPFNSQNTFLARSVLPDYFLYPHVGRMDDIWAAYYVQARGHRVVYGAPSVYQARNEHDLTRDMRAEYLGYEHNLSLVSDLARDPESIARYLPGRAAWAWQLYRRHFSDG